MSPYQIDTILASCAQVIEIYSRSQVPEQADERFGVACDDPIVKSAQLWAKRTLDELVHHILLWSPEHTGLLTSWRRTVVCKEGSAFLPQRSEKNCEATSLFLKRRCGLCDRNILLQNVLKGESIFWVLSICYVKGDLEQASTYL